MRANLLSRHSKFANLHKKKVSLGRLAMKIRDIVSIIQQESSNMIGWL